VSILAGLPPGPYTIQITMYDPETLAPLTTQAIGSLTLGRTLGLDGAGLWDVQHHPLANLGGRVRLLGYSVIGETFKPGDAIPLTFLWQGLAGLDGDYSLLLWLEDEGGARLGEAEVTLSGGYPPTSWQEGEVVRDWQSFLVPGNTPDGPYRLKMEVRQARQPLSRLLWRLPAGTTLDLGEVRIQGRERVFDKPPIEHALEVQLGESVTLLGYNIEPEEAQAGENLRLTLYWECLGPMSTSYTVFVHLLDEKGTIQGQRDSAPGGGALPTTSWVEGEIITDSYEISVDPDAPSGNYTVVAGLYDAATGMRLHVFGADGSQLGDHCTVTQVPVAAP
jgi:hypothetical protein